MKRFGFFLILTAILFSCSNVKNELSDTEKERIKSEILEVWNNSSAGISELNAEKAFSIFSKNPNTKYIRDGHLYPNIETAQNQYAEWFKGPNVTKQNISCDPMVFDIINSNTVLMTTIGKITKANISESEQTPWVLAYTVLWVKEVDGWKVLNMHNSWE